MDTQTNRDAFINVRKALLTHREFVAGVRMLSDAPYRSDSLRLSAIPGCKNLMTGNVLILGECGSDVRGTSARKLAPKNDALDRLSNMAVSTLRGKDMIYAGAVQWRDGGHVKFLWQRHGETLCLVMIRAERSFRIGKEYYPPCFRVYVEFMSTRTKDAREYMMGKLG